MDSYVETLELTKGSSSINNSDLNSESSKVSKEGVRSTHSDSISWNSRLSYHLHIHQGAPVYKFRTFSSRGAFLILILNFLFWAAYGVPMDWGNYYHHNSDHHNRDHDPLDNEPSSFLRTICPTIAWFPAVLVFGLLADVRYGRKKIVLFGIVMLWLVRIIDCVWATTLFYAPDSSPHLTKFLSVFFILDDVLSYIATAAFLINSVQLAIDQLADASAEQVSSFIRWYVFTFMFGVWIFHHLARGPLHYCTNHIPLVEVLTNLAQVVLISLALCLVLVCGDHIKAIPIGDNPLKLIWKVLQFAAKHKYPLYRSALTYWEDEIPSRINLGKDKYGGPFTNEQVEDVKTFFRIISLTVPTVFAVASGSLVGSSFGFSVYWRENTLMDFNYSNSFSVDDHCTRSLYASFPASASLWISLCVLCSEFIIYPIFNRCIPGMLKRIGFAFFLIIPESIIFLFLNIAALAKPMEISELILCSIVSVLSALQYYLLLSSFLEFVCAQSLQSMKGFLIGFVWLMDVLISVISYFIYYPWNAYCTMHGCGTGYFSLVTVFILVGFFVYCKVARWYRNRERDDCPNDQAIVEEVFARRLANRKRLGLDES